MNKCKLLIVDDSPTARGSLLETLESTDLFSSILVCDNGARAIEILSRHEIGFLITDLMMPHIDGFKLLSHIRRQDAYRDLPIILLTGQSGSFDKIKGLDLGANDYVIKPYNPAELIARVKNLLRIKELMEQLERANRDLQRANRRLQEVSITDELTGLYNRRHFWDRLDPEFKRAVRYGDPLSCLLLDIDKFKDLNDTYGHPVGDLALKELGRILKAECRGTDIVARFGGEEFIILLGRTDTDGATLFAERLRRIVEEHSFQPADMDGEIHITLSIGVVSYPNDDVHAINDLIRLADDALYRAKNGGRNRVITV